MTPSEVTTNSIESVDLVHEGLVRFNASVERERVMALEDLVRTGRFAPLKSGNGPYKVTVSLESADRIILMVKDKEEKDTRYGLALQSIRRIIKDYFVMCEALQSSLGKATPDKIEAIDMARRSLHDEAAEEIIKELNGQIDMCLDTSRRIFTLACVLYCH